MFTTAPDTPAIDLRPLAKALALLPPDDAAATLAHATVLCGLRAKRRRAILAMTAPMDPREKGGKRASAPLQPAQDRVEPSGDTSGPTSDAPAQEGPKDKEIEP